ncbi:adenine-specific methyltransferase EcoRI family protein [Negativicoccus succinicivorans]
MKGDGDFRSEECLELLKEADVVVTIIYSMFIYEYFRYS